MPEKLAGWQAGGNLISSALPSPHIILFTSRVDVSHKSQSFWAGCRFQRHGGEKNDVFMHARPPNGPATLPLSALNDRNQAFHSEVLMLGNRSRQELEQGQEVNGPTRANSR